MFAAYNSQTSRHALMDVQLFIVSFTSLTIVNLLLIHTYTSLIINWNDLTFMSTYNHLSLYYVMFPFKTVNFLIPSQLYLY